MIKLEEDKDLEKIKENKLNKMKEKLSKNNEIKELNASNFKENIQKEKWLIDFWAPWCSPCKILSPILDKISGKFDNVNFGKVNVDGNSSIAQNFGVRAIPTLILFENGEELQRTTGVMREEELKQWINSNI